MTLRTRLYALLDPASHGHSARQVRALEVALILVGISSVSAGTVDGLPAEARSVAAAVTGIVAALFFAEYLARLWVAPESPHSHHVSAARARLRWMVSPEGIIDLLAVLPAVATAYGGARLGAESASVFVLLWVLKLATHAPGVGLIARVFHNERSALSAAAALFVIVLFSAATIAHWLEAERQPEHFGSIPASLWWAVVTLTTTGYGDVVPLSSAGRVLGGLLMLCGICVLALLAGILANGFAAEVRRREFVRIWELVARVPFFAEVGAIAITDIVDRLRSRSYPEGATVIRKGAAGDSMFFIVTGEVEVRIGERALELRDGDFFGEMALLDRKPRSADVVTLTPCTVLVLNVADFYQLAGQQPTLIAAIEAEAKRRRANDA
ncbi:MAG: cyclic nucleotide-binding domain-containing protein [Proteobacteria bacterium]|nr:cyclic nucleotide-binding domain-containing protein [Pseudomonadota bacterium]